MERACVEDPTTELSETTTARVGVVAEMDAAARCRVPSPRGWSWWASIDSKYLKAEMTLLPRRRGAPRRAWDRGGPRHLYRWVQRFTPLLADAAVPCRHRVGDRWFVDETYVRVAGRWRYVYRAVDQAGQIIDVYVSPRRDVVAARRFFSRAIRAHGEPVEVVTDRAPALRAAIEGLMPAAFHNTEQYANNRIECDHGRLKARLRPMRGLKRDHTARVIIRGHALVQNIRRGHYELGIDARPTGASNTRSSNSPGQSDLQP